MLLAGGGGEKASQGMSCNEGEGIPQINKRREVFQAEGTAYAKG